MYIKELDFWKKTGIVGHWIGPPLQEVSETIFAFGNGIEAAWFQNSAREYQRALVDAIRNGASPFQVQEWSNFRLSGLLWANVVSEKDRTSPYENFNRCVKLLNLSSEQADEVIRSTISYTVITQYPGFRFPSCRPILDFATSYGLSIEKQKAAVLDGIALLLISSQQGEGERAERRISEVINEATISVDDIFGHPLLQHAAQLVFAQEWNSYVDDISTAEFHREKYGFRLLSPESRKFLAIREILLTSPFDDKTVNGILQAFDITDPNEVLGESLEGHTEWINPNLVEIIFGWEMETLGEYLDFARQYTAYVWRVGSKGRLQPPHTEGQLTGPHPFAVSELAAQTQLEIIRRERLERLFVKAQMIERVFTPFLHNNIPADDPWRNVILQEHGEFEAEERALAEFLIERQAGVREVYEMLRIRANGDFDQMGLMMYEWMCRQAERQVRTPVFAPEIAFHPLGIMVWIDEGGPAHHDFEYIHKTPGSGGFFRNEQEVYEGNKFIKNVPIVAFRTYIAMRETAASRTHELGHGVAYAYLDFLSHHNRVVRWGEAVGLSDERKKEIGREIAARYKSSQWNPKVLSFTEYHQRRMAALRQSSEWNIIQQNMLSHAKNEIIATVFDGDLKSKYERMISSEGMYDYIKDFEIGTRSKLGMALWADYQKNLEREMGLVRLSEEAYRLPGFEEKQRLLKWVLLQLPADEWHDEFYRLGLGEEAELLVNIYRLCDADPYVHKGNNPIPLHIRQINRPLSKEEERVLYGDYWRLYFQLRQNPSLLHINQLRAFIKFIESNRLSTSPILLHPQGDMS